MKIIFIIKLNLVLYHLVMSQNCLDELKYYQESLKNLQEERENLKLTLESMQKQIDSLVVDVKLLKQEETSIQPMILIDTLNSYKQPWINSVEKIIDLKRFIDSSVKYIKLYINFTQTS